MKIEQIGVTFTVPENQDATGVYEHDSGVEVFQTDEPYLLSDGKSLVDPLPVKVVGGPVFLDVMGNAQAAMAVSGLSHPPINTVPPAISGLPQIGQVLTVSQGTWHTGEAG